MARLRFVGISAVVLALFITGGSHASAAAQGEEDGGDYAPSPCPSGIVVSGEFQGQWFYDVGMARVGNPGGGNIADYTNLNEPVSFNKKWVWINGGGLFSCWSYTVPYVGTLYVQTNIPPTYGALIPAPDDEEIAAPPPSGGTGGTEPHEWSVPTAPPPATERVYCDVMDWYVNDVYVETTLESCYIM